MREDVRSFPAVVQEEKRKQAILMWKKKRYTHQEIGAQVGVHYLTVGRWIRIYQTEGLKALRAAPVQGCPVGSGRSMSREQEDPIRKLLIDKMPEQLKLSYALWTREAVQQLIVQETGVRIAIRTVGDYLKCWGFTVHKPKKQIYEQRPAQVRQWLNHV